MKINPINNNTQTFTARKAPDVMERYYYKKSKSFNKKLEYSYDMLNPKISNQNLWDIIKHSSKIALINAKIAMYKALSLYYSGKKEIQP